MEVAIGELKKTLPLFLGDDTPLIRPHSGVIPTLVSCSTVSNWILCFNFGRVISQNQKITQGFAVSDPALL